MLLVDSNTRRTMLIVSTTSHGGNMSANDHPMKEYTREERIARRLCELRKQDPDQWISHGADPDANGFVPAICLHSPLYKRVAIQVQDALLLHEAIRDVDDLIRLEHGQRIL